MPTRFQSRESEINVGDGAGLKAHPAGKDCLPVDGKLYRRLGVVFIREVGNHKAGLGAIAGLRMEISDAEVRRIKIPSAQQLNLEVG